jgi:transcriptional regulator GlxA family with amidase domain
LGNVAMDCGFYDQAAFSRQFRAFTGLSPGEYRRAVRITKDARRTNLESE